ncbi:hypothetical protein CRD59_02020 [Bifidobacterium xylocopae]|uniref:Uncharacterized protein n=1 Tax=Bifidobacterium xylocopae TaxID=2493119 RepID=A0A366KF25_9BIFI|nr:hypothetical protein CRD59_02020 [Bifidobacterium xylocopae]
MRYDSNSTTGSVHIILFPIILMICSWSPIYYKKPQMNLLIKHKIALTQTKHGVQYFGNYLVKSARSWPALPKLGASTKDSYLDWQANLQKNAKYGFHLRSMPIKS